MYFTAIGIIPSCRNIIEDVICGKVLSDAAHSVMAKMRDGGWVSVGGVVVADGDMLGEGEGEGEGEAVVLGEF